MITELFQKTFWDQQNLLQFITLASQKQCNKTTNSAMIYNTSLKPGNNAGKYTWINNWAVWVRLFIKLEMKSEMIWAYILMAIANFNFTHSRSYNNDPCS